VELQALHFPTAFPEVFAVKGPASTASSQSAMGEGESRRAHLLGLRFPGLRSMPIGEQNREVKHLQSARPDLLQEYEEELVATEAMRAVLHASYPWVAVTGPLQGFLLALLALVEKVDQLVSCFQDRHCPPRQQRMAVGCPRRSTFADVTMTTNTGAGYSTTRSTATRLVRVDPPNRPTPSAVISLRGRSRTFVPIAPGSRNTRRVRRGRVHLMDNGSVISPHPWTPGW